MGITNWFLGSSGASFSTGRYVLVYARTCTSSPEFVSIWRHYYIDTLKLPPFSLTLLFVAFCCLRLLLIGLSVLFFSFYLDLDDEFSYWTALRKRIQCNKTELCRLPELSVVCIYTFSVEKQGITAKIHVLFMWIFFWCVFLDLIVSNIFLCNLVPSKLTQLTQIPCNTSSCFWCASNAYTLAVRHP